MKTDSNNVPLTENQRPHVGDPSAAHLAKDLVEEPLQHCFATDDPEEYKYCLVENSDGDNDVLKRLIDLLPSNTAKWLFSARLQDRLLTLSWLGWIPRSWDSRTEAQMPDGNGVYVVHQVLDGLHLAPSLIQSLRYLANLADSAFPFHGGPPQNVVDAIDILDSLDLISVEWDSQFEALETLSNQSWRIVLSRRLRNLVINPSAREFLE